MSCKANGNCEKYRIFRSTNEKKFKDKILACTWLLDKIRVCMDKGKRKENTISCTCKKNWTLDLVDNPNTMCYNM